MFEVVFVFLLFFFFILFWSFALGGQGESGDAEGVVVVSLFLTTLLIFPTVAIFSYISLILVGCIFSLFLIPLLIRYHDWKDKKEMEARDADL